MPFFEWPEPPRPLLTFHAWIQRSRDGRIMTAEVHAPSLFDAYAQASNALAMHDSTPRCAGADVIYCEEA